MNIHARDDVTHVEAPSNHLELWNFITSLKKLVKGSFSMKSKEYAIKSRLEILCTFVV